MVLADHRSIADPILDPLAERLHRSGVRADHLTWTSLVVAAAAGVLFYLATPGRPVLLVPAGILVAVNALFDGLDGKMARTADRASPRGDYLDHAIDRFADVAMLTGLALSAFVQLWIGFLAVVGTLLTSYLGTQAQAVDLGRDLGGLFGRADRLVVLAAAPVVQWALIASGTVAGWTVLARLGPLVLWSFLDAAVLAVAVLGLGTAVQRFVRGLHGLDAP